jgi:hypothetical protein
MPTLFVPVMAACSISNIVKSSLGPVGLDKMLVDDIGVCILWQPVWSMETDCDWVYFYFWTDHNEI